MYNKIILVGRNSDKPVIRIAQNTGTKCVEFSLATSERRKMQNGEVKEDTQWHHVVGWGKVAEVFENLSVNKGTLIMVEGTLRYRKWEKDGQRHERAEVNILNFKLLSPKGNSESALRQQQGNGYVSEPNDREMDWLD